MVKKLLALLLASAMVFSLAACSAETETEAAETEAAETEAAKETEAAETEAAETEAAETEAATGKQTDGKNVPTLVDGIEITLWDIATEDPAKQQADDAIARFTNDYPNITVNVVHTQNDTYKQQLLIAMSSDSCPDMYIHWGGGPMAEYYNSGFVNDLTEMYNTYDHQEYIEAAIAQSSYDGKILAIPFGGLSGCDLFFNKTIFDECGIEYPLETLDDLEAACEVLKENGYVPFSLANSAKWTGSMYYMYLVARHSGNAEFDAAYTQEGSFTSEAFIFACDKIQEWVEKGYFPDGVNSLSPDDGQDRQLMYDGTCAMMLHGSWQASSMNADNAEWYAENIGVMRWPEDSEAAANGVDQKVEVGTAIGNGFSMNCWNEDGSVDQEKLDACFVLATQYFSDDIYVQEKLDTGTIPSIVGCEETIEDPNMQIVADVFFSATNVQLWYDQYLPASVTEVHKNCMTSLFDLSMDGQAIGEAEDEAMQAALAE